MMRYLWIPVCFFALVVPIAVLACSGQDSFDGVVNSIESRYHTHATRIPFLSVVSFVAGSATGQGVGDLHVAEFDNFSADVDGNELNRMVEEKLGQGWQRIIRETSHSHNGRRSDQTLIFARPEGQRMGLFILDLDGHELDVVQVSVDPDRLNQTIARYSHHQDGGNAGRRDVSD